MSENLRDHYVPLPPMKRRSVRYFVDDPEGGWKNIGLQQYHDIAFGKMQVPKWAGKTFRGASALVEADGRKIKGLCYVMISNWKIGADGFIDPDAIRGPTADYSDPHHPIPAHQPERIPTLEDILAIKSCLGISSA